MRGSYDTATNEFWQLTAVGDAYAASWVDVPESEVPALWVSRAEGTATSYLTAVTTDDGARVERIDPIDGSDRERRGRLPAAHQPERRARDLLATAT